MKTFFLTILEIAKAINTILDIKSRRLLIDEYERCEDEINDLEKQIDRHRRSGNDDAANLLLKREARRARLSVRVGNIEKG